MTPFEALYGRRPTNDINSLALPPNVNSRLKTEEDLKAFVKGASAVEEDMVINDSEATAEIESVEVVPGTSQREGTYFLK